MCFKKEAKYFLGVVLGMGMVAPAWAGENDPSTGPQSGTCSMQSGRSSEFSEKQGQVGGERKKKEGQKGKTQAEGAD